MSSTEVAINVTFTESALNFKHCQRKSILDQGAADPWDCPRNFIAVVLSEILNSASLLCRSRSVRNIGPAFPINYNDRKAFDVTFLFHRRSYYYLTWGYADSRRRDIG